LEKELATAKSRLAELEELNKSLEGSSSESKSNTEKIEKERDELKKQVDELKKELDGAKENAATSATSAAEQTQKIEEAENRAAESEAQVAVLTEQITLLEQQIEELTNTTTAMQGNADEVSQMKAKVEELEKERDESKKKQSELEDLVAERTAALDNVQKELSDWENKFTEGEIVQRSELDVLKEQIEQLSAAAEAGGASKAEGEQSGDVAELQKKITALEEDRDQWKDLCDHIETLANQSMTQYEQTIAQMQVAINDLTARKDQLEQDLAVSDQKLASLDAILGKLTHRK